MSFLSELSEYDFTNDDPLCEEVVTSWIVPRKWLTVYRCFMSAFVYATWIAFLTRHDYSFWYFTWENYLLLLIISTLLTFLSLFPNHNYMRAFTSTFAQVLLIDAIFLDIVYWTLLFGGGFESLTVAFVEITIHGLNALAIGIEFFLNNIQLEWISLAVGVTYVLTYSLGVAYIYHLINGDWPYDFLDFHSGPPWKVALNYISMAFLYVLIFLILKLLMRYKRRWARITNN